MATLKRGASVLLLLMCAACADGGEGADTWDSPATESPAPFTPIDASLPAPSTGSGSSSSSSGGTVPGNSTGSSAIDAGSSSSSSGTNTGTRADSGTRPAPSGSDAGAASNPLDDLFGGLLGSNDGGQSLPPPTGDGGTGDWKLTSDSAPECPAEPPPIPIVGGICVGIYFSCNWKNSAGQSYTCICDWIHWLCI